MFAHIEFEREGVGVRAPAQVLSLAFSEDRSRAFLSATDDTGVRLASLGSARASLDRQPLAAEHRAALLGSLRSPKGTVDGAPPPASRQTITPQGVSLPAQTEWTDTLELDGDLAHNEEGLAPSASPNDIIIFPPPIFVSPCAPEPSSYQLTTPICARWSPEGFRDIGVSSSVPGEDYNLEGPAAYANASIYDGSTLVWEGRLDEYGCSPPVTYCMNRAQIRVSTASLAVPAKFTGLFLLYGTREFIIQPARTYIPGISFAYNIGLGTYTAIATVRSSAYPVRVASVVSRVLTMPDNGVLRHDFRYTAPPLTIDIGAGCAISNPNGTIVYGEACAGAHNAYFGPSLGMVGGVYVPTGRHTTEDAYTIAHELGHSMQFAADGGPGGAGYNPPSSGMCSCDHVNDGNRLHCLQSRHPQASAEVEGFAHFYAARVMNDQASTCRFTYYKNYRKIMSWFLSLYSWANIAPPVPVDCGQPFVGWATGAKTQGWVPTFCAANKSSSEYDWLTFLWAVNGSAATSVRSSMTNLFTILGGAGSGNNFTWSSVRAQADTQFGPTSAKAIHFRDSGALHGVNL